jgi:tetratricopeptide (TPR) repeat protein
MPRAIEMLTQCAQHSIEIGRLREAAEMLIKASSLASHPQRHELACRAIRLAHKTSELDVVLRAAGLVDRTNRAGVHDEIEIAELSARGTVSGEKDEAQERLHDCLLASQADGSHRINAGRALLAIADQAGGGGLSRDGFDVLSRLIRVHGNADDQDALKLTVLYHATLGDAQNLGLLSRQLSDAARRERPEIAANLYYYAACGFWRGGEPTEALSSFAQSFEAAESVGLVRAQFLSAATLGSLHHDTGQDDESRTWLDRAERIADELPTLRASLSYIAICFENALICGDVPELKRLLDASTQAGPGSGQIRIARALEICIQRLSGEALDQRAVVLELTKYHVLSRESGNISDLEVAIAADVLNESGDADAARNVVFNYLQNYRRGLGLIAAMLRDTISKLGIEPAALPAWCHVSKRAGTQLN